MGTFITTSVVNTLLNYTTSVYDSRVQSWLPYMPIRLFNVCNTYFHRGGDETEVDGDDFVFSATSGTIRTAAECFTVDGGNFKAGDDIYISGSLRNDFLVVISTVTSSVLTINSASEYGESALIDEDVDEEDIGDVKIRLVYFPKALQPVVANMIRYDMLERVNKKGKSSEKIGNYSVAYYRAQDYGYDYPDDIIGGLNQFIVPAIS